MRGIVVDVLNPVPPHGTATCADDVKHSKEQRLKDLNAMTGDSLLLHDKTTRRIRRVVLHDVIVDIGHGSAGAQAVATPTNHMLQVSVRRAVKSSNVEGNEVSWDPDA